MVERVLFAPGGSTEAKQDLANTAIREILDALLRGRDYFGATTVGTRYNMVEVHFDDTNWQTYGTLSTTGGGNGGSATQANGRVQFRTGTSPNGSVIFETLDFVRYSGGIEIYGAGTHAFAIPPDGANDRYMYWPLGERSGGVIRNGVGIGYHNLVDGFGISYVRGSVERFFIKRADWDDPCDGSPLSDYTHHGLPVALDTTKGMIMQVRAGLFGYSGFDVQILSPDRVWVTIWHWMGLDDAEPVFTNYDLKQVLELSKGAGGTGTSWGGNSACWAAGRMSNNDRITDPLTDRTLVSNNRSVIFAKAPNGSYVQIAANSQGRLQVTNDSVGTDGAAMPAGVTAIGGSDGTNLQALQVLADGTLVARLDAATLAALESVTVGGTVALDTATLAALENTTVAGTVALDAPTLAALESVSATDVTPPNEMRLDYSTRTDKQPVYLGKAQADVAVEANPVWTVTRFTYESALPDARLVQSDVRAGIAWTDRATGW